jgi:hypothetical protein
MRCGTAQAKASAPALQTCLIHAGCRQPAVLVNPNLSTQEIRILLRMSRNF